MSKGSSFALGILTGIILTLVFFAAREYSAKQAGDTGEKTQKEAKLPKGVRKLEEPVLFTGARSFKVERVIFEDGAIAKSGSTQVGLTIYYADPEVLIVSDRRNVFYDDQIVEVPKDCKILQVGTYNYQKNVGVWKTIPIIRFVKAQ